VTEVIAAPYVVTEVVAAPVIIEEVGFAPFIAAPVVGLPIAASMIASPGLDGPFKFYAETPAATPEGDLAAAAAPKADAKAVKTKAKKGCC